MAKNKDKNFPIPEGLYRELQDAAKSKGQTLKEYLDDLLGALMITQDIEPVSVENSQEPIEYETVTLKIPRGIMELLRDSERTLEETPIQFLERTIVDLVRVDIEGGECFVRTPREIAEHYKLDSVFKAITGITVGG